MNHSNDVRGVGRSKPWVRELSILAASVVLLLGIRSSVADHYQVPTGSMIPSVEIGDRIAVNKLAYGARVPFTGRYVSTFTGPQVGDVVVLESPEEDKILLKRVVAGPGDEIAVRAGVVWRNGWPSLVHQHNGEECEQLDAKHHAIRRVPNGGPEFSPVRIPPEQYLVLGDNRGDSADGRSFGLVSRHAILGKAIGVYVRNGWFDWHTL